MASSPPPIVHAVGGSIGSALALLILYPLERLRIDMQKQAADDDDDDGTKPLSSDPSWETLESRGDESSSISLVDTLRRLWHEGELYRGAAPICTTLAVSNFIFFYVHQVLKGILSVSLPKTSARPTPAAWRRIFASSLAGVINVLLTNPLWVTNLRIVAGETETQSLYVELKRIYQQNVRSLWKGTESSLWLVSNPVLQFVVYEHVRQRRLSPRRTSLSAVEAFGVGALAKMVATILTYPLQLSQAVLRLQASSREARQRFQGTLDCLRKLYHRDGLQRGLYRGMRAKLLQTVLSAAFTFLTYEEILHAVHVVHQRVHGTSA